MGDKFALRWKIDNATAKFAAGKAESGVLAGGGFKWTAVFNTNGEESSDVSVILTCAYEGRGDWKCETNLKIVLHHPHSSRTFCAELAEFDNLHPAIDFSLMGFPATRLTDPAQGFIMDDKIKIEFRINITRSELPPPIDLAKFCPNGMGNVTLTFGQQKVRVSKEILAFHSPVFAAMFFGNFAEKDKEEVEIKDVVYEEFLDLLDLLCSRSTKIADYSVPYILKLADQYQMECLVKEPEDHLKQSTGIDEIQKLIFADKFRLETLKNHCLNSFDSLAELATKIKSSPDYANFSDGMKLAICDRMLMLA
ncbi:hypothetical protein PMAYCL1PPCAC_27981 [Pristionchus mayeri]|uniref:BTB domain-containing protein n=1 Tax=Pristionchus mayeri TaxID=1317129 RepID=A0AAN5D6K4_9BILA|nr:hypothetical protein PMAYCL1PPCAC_27981 [Pristionchus mayeri]